MVKVDKKLAFNVLKVVDKGLTSGMGIPKPGKMCVEAAVAYASGELHNDEPACVHPRLRGIKIGLNDCPWSNKQARARGLRRIAIAQLGSVKKFDRTVFAKLVGEQFGKFKREHMAAVTERFGPPSLADLIKLRDKKGYDGVRNELYDYVERLADCNVQLETVPNWDLEDVAGELEDWMPKSKTDERLSLAAEWGVQALKKMKIPGTKYLYLTEKKQAKKARRKHK